MLRGTNTYRYGFYKIGIQFIGGILAGVVIWGFGHLGNAEMYGDSVYNHAISAEVVANKKLFSSAKGSGHLIVKGGFVIFAVEAVMTSILL